jgi:hypothetical protein
LKRSFSITKGKEITVGGATYSTCNQRKAKKEDGGEKPKKQSQAVSRPKARMQMISVIRDL